MRGLASERAPGFDEWGSGVAVRFAGSGFTRIVRERRPAGISCHAVETSGRKHSPTAWLSRSR